MGVPIAFVLFIFFAGVIAIAGYQLVKYADILADITGIGEAFFGAILLGAITSLSGIVTSVTAAFQAHPHLAVSNAMGGIAAQTLFLALADIFYRKANLEHSAASFANLLLGLLLVIMLSFIMLVIFAPEISFFSIHPASVVLIVIYYAGYRLIKRAKAAPMWYPVTTRETVKDTPSPKNLRITNIYSLWGKFLFLGIVVGLSGYMIAVTGILIANETGLTEGLVGSLLTAIVTSFPELFVTIAAIRQKALTLAVANIVGGNSFDILFVSFSDVAYREGSIYHVIGHEQIFVLILTLLLTGILVSGLLIRQKEGVVRIGWESALIILLFTGGYTVLYF